MSAIKLLGRNVRRHLGDYFLYYLTLTLAISLFYAFNAISAQSAFADMGMTRALLYRQLDVLLSALSVVIAVVLSFLIFYANHFLLKRRKKELAIYLLLGMRQSRLAWLFAAETLCVGILALASGLLLGMVLSQGLSMVALKLFAIDLSQYRLIFSPSAFLETAACFALLFFLVILFNLASISRLRLVALLTANRKNDRPPSAGRWRAFFCLLVALANILIAFMLIQRHGLLPQPDTHHVQIALLTLCIGTVLLFYSLSTLFVQTARRHRRFYNSELHTVLVRQLAGKFHGNYLVLAAVCLLLAITISAVTIGASTGLAMNDLARAATPYDLNVTSDVAKDGDGAISEYLTAAGVPLAECAEQSAQISVYEADFTYGDLFSGQSLDLWKIDEALPALPVSVVALSDFNRALAIQDKAPISLGEDQYLLNCNYKGTASYVATALTTHPTLTVSGSTLTRAADTPLQETYLMTSVGNNDRGTLIVPDRVAHTLKKEVNVLLVQYKAGTNADAVIQSLLPIGLDNSHGYRYAEKAMLYDMFYGVGAFVTFLCAYVGLLLLLICAALLALKQITETADNIQRYRLLQKLGATEGQLHRLLWQQIAVFFAAPLTVAAVYAAFLIAQLLPLVEGFMNIHISAHLSLTLLLFFLIYGSYTLATARTCWHLATEERRQT